MEYTLITAACNLVVAQHLSVVEHGSLGDSAYSPTTMLEVLRLPEHHAYLAYAREQPVGFCSCFETPADQGTRLEVDMLGVLPEYRQQGLATRLVTMALQAAQARGVQIFRGVVAVDNIGSQRVFERAGFRRSAAPHKMLVFEPGRNPVDRAFPAGWQQTVEAEGTFHAPGNQGPAFYASRPGREVYRLTHGKKLLALGECLAVQTLAYSGLWVEKLWAASPEVAGALGRGIGQRAGELGLDEAGYLIADVPEEAANQRALLEAGYSWWDDYLMYWAGPK